MPELPEVQTTVNGLNVVLKKLTVKDIWSDYFLRSANKRTDNIKNKNFFEKFKKELIGEKFLSSERRGKNVLIHFSHNKTVLIHMKMTGHLLFGTYEWNKKEWVPQNDTKLADPFNKFIHFIINFETGTSLAFSDMRKFAKITLIETPLLSKHNDIQILGPEANDSTLNWKILKTQLNKKPKGKIKTVLMDQTVVAGIGNIYSDEILWASSIHPERRVETLSDADIKNILSHAQKILSHSITVGGDSMSDYRNIYGERGGYQNSHKAYRRTKQKCLRPKCSGTIVRKVIAGRSAHFCDTHQK